MPWLECGNVSYSFLLFLQETPTNELSVQGTPEGDTEPSTPPAPPTPPHPTTPGDGFPNNDSGFGERWNPRFGLREGGAWERWAGPYYAMGVSCGKGRAKDDLEEED